MKPAFSFLLMAVLAASTARAEIQTDWAYHAIGSAGRLTEQVPGETITFLANGSDQIADGDTVSLYMLTAGDFAGDMDEQIYVRWWDGYMSHWIMGVWVKKIPLDAARPDGGPVGDVAGDGSDAGDDDPAAGGGSPDDEQSPGPDDGGGDARTEDSAA